MASARKVSNLVYHFGSILYLLISTVLESASRHIAVGINVNVRVSEMVNSNRTCNGNKTNSKYAKSWTSLIVIQHATFSVISTTNSQNTNYTSQNITSIYSNTEIVKIFTLSTPTSMSILTDKWSWSQIKF